MNNNYKCCQDFFTFFICMLIDVYVHKHTYIFMLRIYICITLKKLVYYEFEGGNNYEKKNYS